VKKGHSVDCWLVGAAIASVFGGYFKGLNIFCLGSTIDILLRKTEAGNFVVDWLRIVERSDPITKQCHC
jgi:hypothetical protein